MGIHARSFSLALILGLLGLSVPATADQSPASSSPYPSTAPDREILKCSPFIDSTGTLFYGSIHGYFRAARVGTRADGVLWEFTTGGEILSSPAVDNAGTLYFGSADKNVYALNPNGTLKWSFATGGPVVSSPALAGDGSLYVGSKDSCLYALNPDGSLKWSYATGGAIYASPALGLDGTVYVGSLDGKFYAMSAAGELKWTFPTGGAIYSSGSIGFDGEIVFGSSDFNVYALDSDGSLKWSLATRQVVLATPAIDLDGSVYIGSADAAMYRIDPEGNLIWESAVETPIWSSPIIDLTGNISGATCGLYRQYYTTTNQLKTEFTVNRDGHVFSYACSGSADENGKYGFGYTGAFTSAVNGMTIMLLEGEGSYGYSESFSSIRGYDNHTSWPRFRHDSRNTGNVATSLAIPRVDTGAEPAPAFSCDIDRNGRADMNDFWYMFQKIFARQPDPAWDIDNNGRTDVTDAILLLIRIFSGQCGQGSTFLASADFSTVTLQNLTSGQRRFLLDAIDQAGLTPEELELVRAALDGIGSPAGLPRAFSLAQNEPNPFNPSTTIAYEVPQAAATGVNLSVFDIRGRLVRTLVNRSAEPGKHFAFWDGTDDNGVALPSGVYFYRLRAGEFSRTRKMVLLK